MLLSLNMIFRTFAFYVTPDYTYIDAIHILSRCGARTARWMGDVIVEGGELRAIDNSEPPQVLREDLHETDPEGNILIRRGAGRPLEVVAAMRASFSTINCTALAASHFEAFGMTASGLRIDVKERAGSRGIAATTTRASGRRVAVEARACST